MERTDWKRKMEGQPIDPSRYETQSLQPFGSRYMLELPMFLTKPQQSMKMAIFS
jgi:hypothetical protein